MMRLRNLFVSLERIIAVDCAVRLFRRVNRANDGHGWSEEKDGGLVTLTTNAISKLIRISGMKEIGRIVVPEMLLVSGQPKRKYLPYERRT